LAILVHGGFEVRRAILLSSFAAAILMSSAVCAQEKEPYFTNAAQEAGLSETVAGRVVWADINGDGWQDCILQKEFVFINSPDPKDAKKRIFVPFTTDANISVNPKDPKGKRVGDMLILADVDNDGDVDMLSVRYCEFEKPKVDPKTQQIKTNPDGSPVMEKTDDGLRTEILLNDGKGTFSILAASGVGARTETTCAAAFLDYDNDGCLDLYLGNWYKAYGMSLECYPSRLYKGDGKGKFTEMTEKAGMLTVDEPGKRNSSKPVYGVAHCDWNNDGLQDVLVCSYGRQWNMLWKNNGDGTFAEMGEATTFDGDDDESGVYPPYAGRDKEQPFRSNGNTFDAACADFDNDGDIDVFLCEITHSWAGPSSDVSCLLVNQGKEKNFAFVRDTKRGIDRKHEDPNNWNQGDIHAGWLDFDNDGLLDLLLGCSEYPDGNYLRLYRQKPDHTFEDVTKAAGFNWEGSGTISLADYDRDGDVDILVGKSLMRLPAERRPKVAAPALFRNDVGNRNNWVNITLEGKGKGGANRSAIGARVIVKCGDVTMMREVYGGLGHSGHLDSFDLKFGLGQAAKIDSVEVRWPNKAVTLQKFDNVEINKFVKIREGQAKVEYAK
jgi:hypothetical protein